MNIVIVGAGLIGVTCAYLLRMRGHQVTVVEREEGPGRGSSFANATLLVPSMAEPWNSPGCWRALLSSLGRPDAALRVRFEALPTLATWGILFLRNSRAAPFHRNTLKNLRLALHSVEIMASLRRETAVEYARVARGTLKIFRSTAALDRNEAASQQLASHGLAFRRLSAHETVELEPALAPIGSELVGALHFANDEAGDAHRFCMALAERARESGVQFRFRTAITAIESRGHHVTAFAAGQERIRADQYIVAAGSYSTPLLEGVGVSLPVRPAKGYSITLDRLHGEARPRIPIADDQFHAAIVPFGEGVRVAGTAEFSGFNLTLRRERIRNLLTLLQLTLPQLGFDPAAAKPWCGLRPMSADGVPIIGPTPLPNLWVNTGHGHLGWTMAAGSAQMLTHLIDGTTATLDSAPYALGRFRAL